MKKSLCTVLAMVILFSLFSFELPAAMAASSASQVIRINDPVLEKKIREALGKPEGDITLADVDNIDQFDFHNDTREGLPDDQLIHDISGLAAFKNLFMLSLYNNSITDISALSELPGLKFLDIGGNSISDLSPLASLPLEGLDVWGNQVSDVTPLGSIITLTRLAVNDNQISDFSPLAKLTVLKSLMARCNATLDYTPLADIAANLAEKDFDILTTPFDRSEVIAFGDPVLERKIREALGKPEGEITAGDAASLDWLNADAQQDAPDSERIKDISSLRYFVNLTGLTLNSNAVKDISALSEMKKLDQLWLLGNPVENPEAMGTLTGLYHLGFDSGFRELPFLKNLVNLEELRIDACRVLPPELPLLKKLKIFCSLGGELTDISLLAQLPELTVVDVSWNMVTDLTPLAGLPLVELYLAGNPIEDYSPIRDIYPNLLGKNFDYYEMKQPIDPEAVVVFPDPVMELKVRKILEKPEGAITAGDAAKITRLELGNEWAPQIPQEIKVTDLKGIEYFINLRELYADFNSICEFSALSALPGLSRLNLGCNGISDISALSALTNLEDLALFGNRIEDISPLSGLTALRSLHLGNNMIWDISALAGLTALDNLYLDHCGIDDISPLAGMTNMYRLELADNYITDLSALAGMTNIATLKLANNPIRDYSPIQDIYPGLQEKDFEYGQVFDVDVLLHPDQPEEPIVISDAGLEALLREVMDIKDRAITQKDACRVRELWNGAESMWQAVSDITALRYFLNLENLFIFGSGVSDLSPLSGLTRLRHLAIHGSPVSDLTPLSGMKQLIHLELRGDQVTDVTPLQSLTQLQFLDVSNNQITDLSPLYGLDKLDVLYISRNLTADASGFADIAKGMKDKDFNPGQPMETASREDGNNGNNNAQEQPLLQPKDPGKVIKFTDKVLEKKVREAIDKPEGNITAGDAAMVESLNLGNEYQDKFPKGTQIANLAGIEYFINLKSLDISFNKISDIKKLAGLTKLEFLKAFGNQITSITPLAGLVNLNDLNLGANKVTKIDTLKNLAKLTALYLGGNKIKDYSPLAGIYTNLMYTDFDLFLVALAKFPDKEVIKFDDPVLERMVREALKIPKGNITFAAAKKVTSLELGIDWQNGNYPPDTQITSISALKYFVSLQRLELYFHAITDISALAELTQLNDLGLGGNPVQDITPLSKLTNLGGLTLFNCQASDYRPLANLTKLGGLFLDYATINDISALWGLTGLGTLSLKGTQVTDVTPLAGLSNLHSLYLEGAPVADYSPLAAIYPNLSEKDFTLSIQEKPENNVTPSASEEGWQYDGTSHTLFILNDAAMTAYQPNNTNNPEMATQTNAPWGAYLDQIEQIVVGDDVTRISDYAFAYSRSLTNVTIGKNVVSLGWRCLYRCGDWDNAKNMAININCTSVPTLEEDTLGYTWENPHVVITVPVAQLSAWMAALGPHRLQIVPK